MKRWSVEEKEKEKEEEKVKVEKMDKKELTFDSREVGELESIELQYELYELYDTLRVYDTCLDT